MARARAARARARPLRRLPTAAARAVRAARDARRAPPALATSPPPCPPPARLPPFPCACARARAQGLAEDLVEGATRRLHAVLSLFEVSSEALIAQYAGAPESDALKAVTQLNLARVLLHRPDETARKWVRDRAKQLGELLVRHEQTNVFADELLSDDAVLEVATRTSEAQALSAGALDAASLPLPSSGRAPTAADLAARVNVFTV